MPKLKPETSKLRSIKLVKAYQEAGFNQHELARREGVSQSAIAQRLKREYVQATIAELMDKAGLTDDVLAQKIIEGINAKETKIFQFKGSVVETRDVIDYGIRHKYISTALEVKKHIKAKEDKKPLTVILRFGYRRRPEESVPSLPSEIRPN